METNQNIRTACHKALDELIDKVQAEAEVHTEGLQICVGVPPFVICFGKK